MSEISIRGNSVWLGTHLVGEIFPPGPAARTFGYRFKLTHVEGTAPDRQTAIESLRKEIRRWERERAGAPPPMATGPERVGEGEVQPRDTSAEDPAMVEVKLPEPPTPSSVHQDENGLTLESEVSMYKIAVSGVAAKLMAPEDFEGDVTYAVKASVANGTPQALDVAVDIQGLDSDEFEVLAVRLSGKVGPNESRTLTHSTFAAASLFEEVDTWRVKDWTAWEVGS